MSFTSLFLRPALRWLTPGLGIKRWLLLMTAGIAMLGLGVGFVLVEIYRDATLPNVFYYLTLQFVPRLARAVLIGIPGVGFLLFGLYKFNQSLLSAVRGTNTQPIMEQIWQRRIGVNGPRIVAIGGGHGLAALLRGVKRHTSNITAIVTVADDGGSSGRLRRDLGMLPPGDFRMCIAALADDESLVTQLMQYRFGGGDGLAGHSFGNLFIAALAQITGSFERALEESGRVVASAGRIIPSTLSDVVLCAEFRGAVAYARGESSIGKQGLPIERVWLEPQDPPAYPGAVKAILDADLIVLGPGSLWTSIMPNLLVPGLVDALRQVRTPIIYVANITTERGETDHFTLADHIDAIERHIGRDVVDYVLVNNHAVPTFTPPVGVEMVQAGSELTQGGMHLLCADLVSDSEPWRHNSAKLATAIMEISSRSI
ncbi:MAG: YvcK family protein [Chloroflexi bacterium]|nr:YvcK family protein [Chloroflexota bacterium]